MTVLCAEIRRGAVLRWSPLIAVAYLGILYFSLDSWRGLWPETSSAATQPVVVLLIVGAMAAAHRGFKASEAEKSDIFSASARAVWNTDLIRTAALGIEVVGLYAALAAVPFLDTAMSGAPGAPRISLWVLSALGLICVVSLSYTVGRLTPARFTPMIMGVLSYCLIAVIPQYSALGLWVPALAIVDQNATASAFAAKVLLAVAGVLSACSSASVRLSFSALRGHSENCAPASRKLERSLYAFVASIACIVLGIPLGAGTALLQARTPDAGNVICDSSSGSEICFWSDHASLMPGIAAMAEKLEKVTDGLAIPKPVYVEKGISGQDEGIEVGYGGSAIWTGLINSALPPFRICPAESDVQLKKRVNASTLAATWVEAKVRGEAVLQGEYEYTGFDPTRNVKKVLKLRESDQRAQAERWIGLASSECGRI